MSVSVRRLYARHWGLVGAAAAVAAVVGEPGVGGIVAGGAMTGVSLLMADVGLRPLLGNRYPSLAIGFLFVKLAAFLGLGWMLLASGRFRLDPLGFAVGVTCLPTATIWEVVRARGR